MSVQPAQCGAGRPLVARRVPTGWPPTPPVAPFVAFPDGNEVAGGKRTLTARPRISATKRFRTTSRNRARHHGTEDHLPVAAPAGGLVDRRTRDGSCAARAIGTAGPRRRAVEPGRDLPESGSLGECLPADRRAGRLADSVPGHPGPQPGGHARGVGGDQRCAQGVAAPLRLCRAARRRGRAHRGQPGAAPARRRPPDAARLRDGLVGARGAGARCGQGRGIPCAVGTPASSLRLPAARSAAQAVRTRWRPKARRCSPPRANCCRNPSPSTSN